MQHHQRGRVGAGDRVDVHSRRDRPHRLDILAWILDEVRLVEDDHGRRATVPGDEQVSLDAPRIEVAVEPADEEDDVDVRGDDLLLRAIPRRAAREPARSRQHSPDASGTVITGRVEDDPVADRRELGARGGMMAQATQTRASSSPPSPITR